MKKNNLRSCITCCLLLGFLLGIHNGQIAIWKGEDPLPWKVLPYPASVLPQEARQALKKGIPFETMEDLEDLIEKYLPKAP